MGRFLTGRGIPPLMLAASQLGAATVLLGLTLPFTGLESPTWRFDAVASLLVLGALGTGAAYVLNYRIIDDEGPTAASVVTYLLPIVAVILGWLLLHEAITATIAVGIVLILVGVTLSRKPRAENNRRSWKAS